MKKQKLKEYGNIKIEQGKNEYRIDVTAESGTVRTYIIKLKDTEKTSTDTGVEDTDSNFEKNESNDIEQNSIEANNVTNNYELVYIAVGTTIVLFIFTCIIIKRKKKKGKHNK